MIDTSYSIMFYGKKSSLVEVWEFIKLNIPFKTIQEKAYQFSKLNFHSTQEIEEEFNSDDMFLLCSSII